MTSRRGLSFLLLVCACAAAAADSSPARGALASAQGGSGLSGTLSSNPRIRRQQLICDPEPPDLGSTSVLYNPAVSILVGIDDGPGYAPPASGPGGYVQFRESDGDLVLEELGRYINTVDEFGPGYYPAELGLTPTGYVQVFYRRTGLAGQILVPAEYDLVDNDPGVTGTEGVDPFALYFDAADTDDPNPVGRYTVFAAEADTFSGNSADFLQVLGTDGYTVGPAQIAPVTVEGPFVPEPAGAAVIALGTSGLLLCRRRGR